VSDKIDNRPQSWRVCCEEPFRVFFPAGVLLGLIGVSLWPLFYSGIGIPYPNGAHARLMIEGFMASFIFGFLGTAGPRLTSAPRFSLFELAAIFTLVLLAAGLHISGADRAGDFCFLLCLIVFTGALAKRFRQRKDSPPPNFVLVGLGLRPVCDPPIGQRSLVCGFTKCWHSLRRKWMSSEIMPRWRTSKESCAKAPARIGNWQCGNRGAT